jgi:hypothetical protein
MLKSIPSSDVVTRQFKVNKHWSFDETNYPIKWATGSLDGNLVEEYALYRTIAYQYYTDPTNQNPMTSKGYRKSYTSDWERTTGSINPLYGVIPIPQDVYGEKIKRGSVTLTYDNNTYTDDHYSNLLDVSGNHFGNVFYNEGLVVMTGLETRVTGSYSLQLRGTVTIYENEVLLTVGDGEFNVSQNPSALTTGSLESGSLIYINPEFWEYDTNIENDPTGSYLAPYITTIGLYDDDNNLVVVGKLGKPMKSLPDYPINFIIRWDS